jgi:hypothetical protein
MDSHNDERGYVLLYTLLAASLFGVLATGVLLSTLREISLSEVSVLKVKARWAAEAGVECVKYWDSEFIPSAFNTTGETPVEISCDTLVAPWSELFVRPESGTTDCNGGYDVPIFRMGPFYPGDNACALTEVTVADNLLIPEICNVTLNTRGFNDCTTRETEIVIWSTGNT